MYVYLTVKTHALYKYGDLTRFNYPVDYIITYTMGF